MQKVVFYIAGGYLSHGKRQPFAAPGTMFLPKKRIKKPKNRTIKTT